MKGPEHLTIVKLAFGLLPASSVWQRLRLEKEVLGTCLLPDEVAIPLRRGERGPWRAFFPGRLPKFNFEKHARSARPFMPDSRFYLGRVLRLLRSGEPAAAARFIGVYSHYLGDFSQPAHYYELDIGLLFPPPASMRNCEYHRLIEDIPADLRPFRYRPRLLGESLAETLFRLEGRCAALFRRSTASVIPMVRAVYTRRNERATRVLNRVVAETARLLADVLLTLGALAEGRFPPRLAAQLRTCDLRAMEPHAYDTEFNYSHRPLVDSVTVEPHGRARPFALRMGTGGPAVAPGICAIPHALPLPGTDPVSALVYRLPRGVFRRFEAVVGLLAGVRPQAPSRFEVNADGQTLFRGRVMREESRAERVSVDVRGRRTLTLGVRTDGSTDKLAFPIWGNPVLRK